MPLDEFIPRVRERRRTGPERYDFTVDLRDGSWWWVNDRRMSNGWTLVVATDISSIKYEEFRLRDAHASALKASETDFLTGLPNRRSGVAQAEAELNEFRANRLPLTIAVLDIDRFKRINDTYGHEAGDMVLVRFAQAVRSGVNSRDHVSRLGGEEFLVTMPDTTAPRAALRIQRLLHKLGPIECGPEHQPVQISFSAGLATAHHSEELSSLMARADSALYSAKNQGRSRVAISPSPDSEREPRAAGKRSR